MALLALASTAFAYGHARAINANGIEIPALTHGQVIPMDNAYADIMAAANSMSGSDTYTSDPRMTELLTVMSWTRWQTTFALGRIIPGSLGYEAVPTHKPSHASLAGAREVLVRMHAIAGGQNEIVTALFARVNDDMATYGAGINDCRYSMVTFNTSSYVGPDITLQQGTALLGGAIVLLAFLNFRHLFRREALASAA